MESRTIWKLSNQFHVHHIALLDIQNTAADIRPSILNSFNELLLGIFYACFTIPLRNHDKNTVMQYPQTIQFKYILESFKW